MKTRLEWLPGRLSLARSIRSVSGGAKNEDCFAAAVHAVVGQRQPCVESRQGDRQGRGEGKVGEADIPLAVARQGDVYSCRRLIVGLVGRDGAALEVVAVCVDADGSGLHDEGVDSKGDVRHHIQGAGGGGFG